MWRKLREQGLNDTAVGKTPALAWECQEQGNEYTRRFVWELFSITPGLLKLTPCEVSLSRALARLATDYPKAMHGCKCLVQVHSWGTVVVPTVGSLCG